MAKTEFLQIRMSPDDRARLVRAAASDYLEVSTWARRAILRALDQWEARGEGSPAPRVKRVAESGGEARRRGRRSS